MSAEIRPQAGAPLSASEILRNAEQLAGRTILVTLPDNSRYGYSIQRIESTPDGSLIVLAEDPGFTIREDGQTEFLYFPQRELSGTSRYRILTSARWKRQ